MPATINSLKDDLLNSILKRPDLADMSTLHIKNAILKAHAADFWIRDLFETNFAFGAKDTVYTLYPETLIPRYRVVKYLNAIDPVTGFTIQPMKKIDVGQFLDGYNYIRDNSFYQAGNTLKIRVSAQYDTYGIGCFLFPDTTLTVPSWIADQYPFAILYEAARTMYKIIGKADESRSMELLVGEAMAEVKMSGIDIPGDSI